MKKFLIIIMLAALQGCTWVELDQGAEDVKVVEPQHVGTCKLLGKTTVSVKSTVAGIERNDEDIQKELEILARNHAVDLKGDTIVPVTDIKGGKRTYDVYRCKQAGK